MPSGMNAATTITSGKNDTNAFPASATLRSMNSTSSIRSHTRHTSSRSNRVRRAAMRVRLSLLPVHGRGRLVRRRRLRAAARVLSCALAISFSISASRSPQVVCTTFVFSAPASSGSMSVPTLLTATTISPDCPDSSSSPMASTSFFGMLWWKWPTSAPAPAPATTPDTWSDDGQRRAGPRQVLGRGVVPLDLQLAGVVLGEHGDSGVIELAALGARPRPCRSPRPRRRGCCTSRPPA